MRIALAYTFKGSCITVQLTKWFCCFGYILALAIAGKLSVMFGSMLGWIMTCSYVGSRIPQLVKNYRRGMTTGLSLPMFVLLVLGSTTYVASIFVRWVNYTLFESYHSGFRVKLVCGEMLGKCNPQNHKYAILCGFVENATHKSTNMLFFLFLPGQPGITLGFSLN